MAWWFGRKSAPEPVRPLVPSWLSAPGGEGFARSYEAQFEEVYRSNPVGQRAVRLVSGLIGSLAVYSDSDKAEAEKVVGSELLESIAAALLLHGNAYVQLLAGADDRPQELVLLRPERVSVETDAQGWPVGYRYRAGGKVTRLRVGKRDRPRRKAGRLRQAGGGTAAAGDRRAFRRHDRRLRGAIRPRSTALRAHFPRPARQLMKFI